MGLRTRSQRRLDKADGRKQESRQESPPERLGKVNEIRVKVRHLGFSKCRPIVRGRSSLIAFGKGLFSLGLQTKLPVIILSCKFPICCHPIMEDSRYQLALICHCTLVPFHPLFSSTRKLNPVQLFLPSPRQRFSIESPRGQYQRGRSTIVVRQVRVIGG